MFDIDKEKWTLDLREGTRAVSKGAPADKADLTLTVSDDNFVKLVNGKLGPQQVCAGSTHIMAAVRTSTALVPEHERPVRVQAWTHSVCCLLVADARCCRHSSCGS